jgi:hypothetical protein
MSRALPKHDRRRVAMTGRTATKPTGPATLAACTLTE